MISTGTTSGGTPRQLTTKRKSIEDLKQIFPMHNDDYLNDILDRSDSIDEAVASVLDNEIINTPLLDEGK